MKKLFLLLFLAACVCSGCARYYILTLTNGTQIGATSRPVLRTNVYVFKDMTHQETSIPAGRVQEIAPASMVRSTPMGSRR